MVLLNAGEVVPLTALYLTFSTQSKAVFKAGLLSRDLCVRLQLQESVKLVNPGVSQLCIRSDGKLLASAGWDHRVRIFGWKKLRPLAVLQYHTDMVLSVAFSDPLDPRQRLLAAGSKDQRISLWSIYNEGAATG